MNSSISNNPKRGRGRPATGRDPMVGFRAPLEVTAALDRAAQSEEPATNRAELIRRIVTDWLRAKGLLKADEGIPVDKLTSQNDG